LRQSVDPRCFSLVDISHRDLAIEVSGPTALRLLCGACPLDLARMAVGRATRTLFGDAEVVIFRRETATFELTAGRSYMPYVEALLAQISREVRLVG
jgi:sarcosine oxidase subunit gamma